MKNFGTLKYFNHESGAYMLKEVNRSELDFLLDLDMELRGELLSKLDDRTIELRKSVALVKTIDKGSNPLAEICQIELDYMLEDGKTDLIDLVTDKKIIEEYIKISLNDYGKTLIALTGHLAGGSRKEVKIMLDSLREIQRKGSSSQKTNYFYSSRVDDFSKNILNRYKIVGESFILILLDEALSHEEELTMEDLKNKKANYSEFYCVNCDVETKVYRNQNGAIYTKCDVCGEHSNEVLVVSVLDLMSEEGE